MDFIYFPLYLSLKVSILATIIAFVFGLFTAWLLATYRSKWTVFLGLFANVPLILPPTVLGYYLLLFLGRQSVIGQKYEQFFGVPIVFTWQAAVIAASIACFPLLMRPIQAAFESIDKQSIDAAQLDGANRFQILIYILIPLSYRGLIAGCVLGFARAMGEFGATLMIAGNIPGRTQTLSIAIYDAVQADRMNDAHLMAFTLSMITIGILYLLSTIRTK